MHNKNFLQEIKVKQLLWLRESIFVRRDIKFASKNEKCIRGFKGMASQRPALFKINHFGFAPREIHSLRDSTLLKVGRNEAKEVVLSAANHFQQETVLRLSRSFFCFCK